MFDDAALDQAVQGIVNGIFFNQGHVCCAGLAAAAAESVADEVVEKLWRRMCLLRVGDPLDKNYDIQGDQLGRATAADRGAGGRRRARGARPGGPSRYTLPERGYRSRPTLFTDVAPVSRIAVQEIFGPVVSVMTFRTQAEAVEGERHRVAWPPGCGPTRAPRALAVARGLKAGTIWQNTYNQFDPTSPFGGYKESSFGRGAAPPALPHTWS